MAPSDHAGCGVRAASVLVVVVPVKGMAVRVVEVVDVVAVGDGLVTASFAVFVRFGAVVLDVRVVRGHRGSSEKAQAWTAASAARAFANAAMLCA